MRKDLPKRKRLHLENFDYSGGDHVYYLTLCSHDRKPYFSDDLVARIALKELERRHKAEEIKLFCYCIMPDHIHLLLSLGLGYGKTLNNWISAFKRYITRGVKEKVGIRNLWQKNYYEHVLRREESLKDVGEYILNNPVRKRISGQWSEYPFCGLGDDLK